jgi:hypothetical protein
MARKFVSPGVFTSELDRSYLAQGVAAIGAAVVGRSLKGPAFAPTPLGDFNEFSARFGDVNASLQAPYALKNYLKNSSAGTFVRVLGSRDGQAALTNGWNHKIYAIVATGSDTLAQIHVLSGTIFTFTGDAGGATYSFSGTSGPFAAGVLTGTLSFNSANTNYLENVLNFDPTKANQYGHYVYKFFKWAGSGSGGAYATASISGVVAATTSFDFDYSEAATPWVLNQYGDQLFKLYTISDGAAANTDIKVTITNIKKSSYPSITPYGTFDVVIRGFSDTDNRPQIRETFSALTLDPTSPNYLPRMIGDQYVQWDSTLRKNVVYGTYKNRSKYVFLELGNGDFADDSLPWGHSGYAENQTTVGSASYQQVPYVSDNLDSQSSVIPTYWGLDFAAARVADRLKALAHTSLTSIATSSVGRTFSLLHVSGTSSAVGTTYYVYNTGSSAGVPTTASHDGFTVAFAGGFDGWDLTSVNPTPTGSIPAAHVATLSYKLAVDALSNPDEVDLNLLALPGITENSIVGYAQTMCNNRADCLFIMDIAGTSVSNAISTLNNRGLDDNYATTYYPDLRYADDVNGVLVRVKPSVAVLGAYAFSDRVGQVFFAPAGLNRGGLGAFGIVDVCDRLTYQDRNDLYDARINPIAFFPNEGIVVFGQKTLQARPSALDRVNVRRLLIHAKKLIASAAKYLLFEPNNPSTWDRFLRTVNPILEKIRYDQGLERFKIVMDSTVNTPDLIDRNVMTGKIFLQPTKAAEFIDLGFIISASGVSFEE